MSNNNKKNIFSTILSKESIPTTYTELIEINKTLATQSLNAANNEHFVEKKQYSILTHIYGI